MASRDADQLLRRLQKDPDDAAAFLALRNLYDAEQDWASLAELLEARGARLAQADPPNAADLYYRASELWLDRLSDVGRGGGALVHALEADGLHRNASLRLEQLYREAGDWRSLVHTLERRVQALQERDPTSGSATRHIAAIQHQLGEIWEHQFQRADRAIFHYRKAFETDPSCVAAYYAARELYRRAGNFKAAAVLYDLEANAEPDPLRKVALYRELAHMRTERLGDIEGAVVALKRASAIAQSDVAVMQELGATLLRRAEAGGSEHDRRRAADLFYQIAQMVDASEAQAWAEAALDAAPDHEGALGLLTEQLGLSDQTEVLRERYRTFLEAAPDSPHALEVRRWLGRIAVDQGPVEEAIACFEVLRDAGDPEAPGVLADLYRRTGRPQDLARSLTSSIESLPTTERVPRLRELSQVHLSLGEIDQAADCMQQILRDDPGDPEAFAFLEDHYRDKGDWDSLRDLLLAAVRVPGASLASRVLRLRTVASICEEQIDDPDGAAMAWRGVAALDPSDQEARTALQRLLAAAGKWDDLVKVLEKEALATVDLSAKIAVYRRLADVHASKRRDAAAACAALHRILEMAPNDQPAIVALDDAYEAAGRFPELTKLLRRRVEAANELSIRMDLRRRLAWVLDEKLGDHDAAFSTCLQAIDEVPDDAEILARMRAIDERLGRWDRLLETLAYETEVTVEPAARADIHLRMAVLAEEKLGDDKRAVELLGKSLDLRPGDKETLSALERLLGKQGRWRELIKVLHRLRDLEVDSAQSTEINRRLGRLYADRLGEPDAAIDAWKRVLQSGEDPEALDSLARHALATEKWEDLARYLERLAPLAPDIPRRRAILVRRAQVLAADLAREDEAIEVLEGILANVDPAAIEAVELLRGIHEQRGDHPRTAEAIERQVVLTEEPEATVDLLVHLAALYEDELTDRERATSAWERVRAVDADNEGALAALQRLYEAAERWSDLLQVIRDVVDGPMEEGPRVRLLARMSEVAEQQLGDREQAWGLLVEAFRTSPEIDDALENLRKGATRLGKAAELAATLAETANQTTAPREQGRLWREAALAYEVGLGDARRALESTLRAFATDPEDLEYLDEVDRLAARADAWDRVNSVYDALARRAVDSAQRIKLLERHALLEANVHDDPSRALDLELRVLELQPDDAPTLERVEKLAHTSKRYEDLITVYDRLCGRAETVGDRVSWMLRAAKVLHENLAERERAFQVLRNALLVDPFDEVHAGDIAHRVRELDRAAPAGERGRYQSELVATVRDLAGQHAEAPRLRSKLLHRVARIHSELLEDSPGAFEALKDALEATPTDVVLYDEIEKIAGEINAWEALVEHYAKVLRDAVDPDAARLLHGRRARVLESELERPLEAADHLWRLWELGSADDQPAERLKTIFRQAKQWNDLLLVFERELGGLGGDADADTRVPMLREAAHVWEKGLGNPYEAVEAYERLLGDRPEDAEAFEALERLYRSQFRWDDVVGLLTTARQSAPPSERGSALARAAVVLSEKLRRPAEAETTLERAVELAPDASDVIEAKARVEAAASGSIDDFDLDAEMAPKFELGSGVRPLPEPPDEQAGDEAARADAGGDGAGARDTAPAPAEEPDEQAAGSAAEDAGDRAPPERSGERISGPPVVPGSGSLLVREAVRTAMAGGEESADAGEAAEISESSIVLADLDADAEQGGGDLTLPARSPYVPDDGETDLSTSEAGRAAERPQTTIDAPDRAAEGGDDFARLETGDVVATESAEAADFSPIETGELPTGVRAVPTEDPAEAETARPAEAQEPSGETLLDDALIIEATSSARPSADVTGELDADDVLEAVDFVEAEMPKPPPKPPSPKAKATPPPPPPSPPAGGSKKGKNKPPPVPRGKRS